MMYAKQIESEEATDYRKIIRLKQSEWSFSSYP